MTTPVRTDQSAVAVVAMSCIFPGACDTASFWDNLTHLRRSVAAMPDDVFYHAADQLVQTEPRPDKAYARHACRVEKFTFNPEKFAALDRNLLAHLDPLHQWVLTAAEAGLDQAVLDDYDKERIGVILAAIALPTRESADLSGAVLFNDMMHAQRASDDSGAIPQPEVASPCARVVSSPAALVAQAFGLCGGSLTLDAACASSLYAVKLACDELLSHRSDVMLAGGVSGADALYTQIGFSQLKALSASGRCAPFDRGADGLVVGEGAGILVLKRLADALRDGDTVYGVIRGIGLSNDMRGNLLAPESAGQLRAMRAAYTQAGWAPETVDYIECHGAGTRVGDATEIQSLVALWADRPWQKGQCRIGSVKSMIGHLLTGAGAAGLIKTLLGLHHGILPPSLNFQAPPENSPLANSPFQVQTQPQPWPRKADGSLRRAAVSAFGFGGINAHVLVEAFAPSQTQGSAPPVVSASSEQSRGGHAMAGSGRMPVAIVGLECFLGSLTTREAFQHSVFNGAPALKPLEPERCKISPQTAALLGIPVPAGAFITDFTLLVGEFRIPPGEIPDILPQQLLMLKTAAGAMQDAGLPLRRPRERMGAVIGIGFDYQANNFALRWSLAELVHEWAQRTGNTLDHTKLATWLEHSKRSCGPPLTPSRTLGALGGIVASRIAREFQLGGPSFVVSAEETSGLRALEIGTRLLQAGEVDCMLAGAVDLFCDERNLLTVFKRLPLSRKGRIRAFDAKADGTLPGEGAVAFVLKRLDDALNAGDRIYAVVKGFGSAGSGGIAPLAPSAGTYLNALNKALDDAGVGTDAIGLIEAHGSGIPDQDDCETAALSTVFGREGQTAGTLTSPGEPAEKTPIGELPASSTRLPAALGSVRPIVGHSGVVSGLASAARAVLSLYQRLLPPAGGYGTPKNDQLLHSRLHLPQKAAYWSRNSDDPPRTACVASLTSDGNCMHAVLGEAPQRLDDIRPELALSQNRPLGPLPFGVFLVDGDTGETLLDNLKDLQAFVEGRLAGGGSSSRSIERLAHGWHHGKRGIGGPQKTALSLVADSPDSLFESLRRARRCIADGSPSVMDRGGGCCYRPDISGEKGELAFVFPGSGNHYVGLGRTLGAHWPSVLTGMERATRHFRHQLLPHLYDPWRSEWPSGWQAEAYRRLSDDPLNTIFGQVVFGGQMSALLNLFKLIPRAVIGYSLGESAGLFAAGAWPDRGRMLQRLTDSDLFKTQLAGAYKAVRQAWQLPENEKIVWRVAAVNRSAAAVDSTLKSFTHVRRLIVNTPDECVIGGLEDQVVAAVRQLGCEAVYLDGVVAVHCDAAAPVADAYEALHLFPTTPPEDVRFYSCAWAKSYALSAEKAAASILSQALEGFDFTKTIEQAYQDGVRLFVEVGPHCSCTRMIDRILDGRPHMALAANVRGEDECLSLLKCLGSLWAAGCAVDLDALYGYPETRFWPKRQTNGQTLTVSVRGHKPSISPVPVLAPTPMPPRQAAPPPQAETRDPARRQNHLSEHPAAPAAADEFEKMLQDLNETVSATARAHQQFLDFSEELTRQFGETFALQNTLLKSLAELPGDTADDSRETIAPAGEPPPALQPVAFTREQCLEFAVGSVGKVLGPEFDCIDAYKARVRLPDEPLMLVDRILTVEGRKCGLGSGRVVTEHDVLPETWYLDGGRAPVCIAVEAGQADLFLSSYLGIDHQVKGERTYRLLDATIVFHRGLPRPGETIRYDIHIDKFVKQGQTYLFFFRYEGYIGAEHLITMTDGCAGFFTAQEVDASGGILLTDEDRAPGASIAGEPFETLAAAAFDHLDDSRIQALRQGDAGACFGEDFDGIVLPPALRLPSGRMHLIDRILELNLRGGRFGLGYVKAEADIHPDAWFLTCHFVDDKVMPGTLMYECCAHTLRVLLLQMGWLTDSADVCYEPVQSIPCRLKCRGPVTPQTQRVHYAVEIKAVGCHPQPYVIADAHMYADGRYIVFFKDMSMQMTGITADEIRAFWRRRSAVEGPAADTPPAMATQPLFTREQILEFAVGRPSKAFGAPYAVFDEERRIARLPGPPYCFIDRISAVEPQPWQLKPGGWVTAHYDVPEDGWYFSADKSGFLPFCVLLEIALQPCGWLAAYAGSALHSQNDLKFRNLGGSARMTAAVRPQNMALTMRSRLTKVSEAADMIIEYFDFEVLAGAEMIYQGSTYFGFFTTAALAQQIGLREPVYTPTASDTAPGSAVTLKNEPPFSPQEAMPERVYHPHGLQMPAKALRMIDTIQVCTLEGGPGGLGFIRGTKGVDPAEWFFEAHFYQDPVCPGSLGIESFLQIVKYFALKRWPRLVKTHTFEPLCHRSHAWSYRGQVIPANKEVTVEAVITGIEDGPEPLITADGCLMVDGLLIYKMEGFGFRLKLIN